MRGDMSARESKVVKLVPADKDPLLGKLDTLALQIANGLTAPGASELALDEKIAGLKALTAFWQARDKGRPASTDNAFDAYRSKIANAEEN